MLAKPATRSAPVAHRVIEVIAKATVLSDGVLSLLLGSPLALPNIVRESVRENVEADRLNCAVRRTTVDLMLCFFPTMLIERGKRRPPSDRCEDRTAAACFAISNSNLEIANRSAFFGGFGSRLRYWPRSMLYSTLRRCSVRSVPDRVRSGQCRAPVARLHPVSPPGRWNELLRQRPRRRLLLKVTDIVAVDCADPPPLAQPAGPMAWGLHCEASQATLHCLYSPCRARSIHVRSSAPCIDSFHASRR